jgi:iron complex outermembrane recepter protein
MKTIYMMVMGLFSALFLQAQNGSLILKGKVSGNDKPIEAATVTLHQADSSKIKTGTADKDGKFSLELPKAGSYLISISAVGYQVLWSGSIAVKEGETIKELTTLQMKQSVAKLDEVVVMGKKTID